MRISVSTLAALVLGASAAPAVAQEMDSNADSLTIGVGGSILPRYEGADKYDIGPAVAARGKFNGIGFTLLGTGLFVDVVPAPKGPATKIAFGPMVHATFNRSSLRTVRDPQIVALGKIPIAVEAGAHLGVQRTGVITSDYDTLSFDVAAAYDVTGVHDSLIVTPSINYGTPLSRKAFVGISASATHVGRGYANRYFGIDNRQFLASGPPAYNARPGFKDLTFTGLGSVSLTGDLLHGLAAFATGSYSRLLGSFARSPVVRDRNQLFGAIGLAYTF